MPAVVALWRGNLPSLRYGAALGGQGTGAAESAWWRVFCEIAGNRANDFGGRLKGISGAMQRGVFLTVRNKTGFSFLTVGNTRFGVCASMGEKDMA